MIIITGGVTLRQDSRNKGLALGCEHSARSRSEPGCISHRCYIDAEDPSRLHFFEQWEDMDAVQKHFAVPESGAFMARMRELSEGSPEIAIFAADPISLG